QDIECRGEGEVPGGGGTAVAHDDADCLERLDYRIDGGGLELRPACSPCHSLFEYTRMTNGSRRLCRTHLRRMVTPVEFGAGVRRNRVERGWDQAELA